MKLTPLSESQSLFLQVHVRFPGAGMAGEGVAVTILASDVVIVCALVIGLVYLWKH